MNPFNEHLHQMKGLKAGEVVKLLQEIGGMSETHERQNALHMLAVQVGKLLLDTKRKFPTALDVVKLKAEADKVIEALYEAINTMLEENQRAYSQQFFEHLEGHWRRCYLNPATCSCWPQLNGSYSGKCTNCVLNPLSLAQATRKPKVSGA